MKIIYVIIYFLLSSVLLSCTQDNAKDYTVFRYNQINHISSLDPAFAKSQNNIWATHHLFNGLVRLDDSLRIVPDIAKSWTISPDGKRYTFALRDDVYFHKDPCFGENSTRAVTAEDFRYSFSRILSEEVNSPGSWLFSDKLDTDGFIAVDDTTFIIEMKRPFIPFLGILTMQYCSVVPHEAVEAYGREFKNRPIGTGPFVFKRWEPNQALFLRRNKEYFRPSKHNLDGIKTSFIPDKKIAFLELMNGNIDYISGLESSFIQDLLTRDGKLHEHKKETLQFQKAPYLNMEYIGLNITATDPDSPLRKKAFRQALNYGVDRKLMLQSLRNNVGKPAHSGIIPRGLPDYDSKLKGYNYDPEKARKLIEGLELKATPKLELYTNKDYLDLTTFIAKQWEAIGIETDIVVRESNILRDGMRKGNAPMFRASWIADYPDAESFLCLFYSKYPAPPNYTHFSDASYDKLYEASIQESDVQKRHELHQKMNAIVIEEAPVVFLFYDEAAQFFSPRTSGISPNAINLLKVEDIVIQ